MDLALLGNAYKLAALPLIPECLMERCQRCIVYRPSKLGFCWKYFGSPVVWEITQKIWDNGGHAVRWINKGPYMRNPIFLCIIFVHCRMVRAVRFSNQHLKSNPNPYLFMHSPCDAKSRMVSPGSCQGVLITWISSKTEQICYEFREHMN